MRQIQRIIITGLPGMGKSWLGEQLRKLLLANDQHVCLLDDYPFMLQAAEEDWSMGDETRFVPIGGGNFDIAPGRHNEVFARALEQVARATRAMSESVCVIEVARNPTTLVSDLACLLDDGIPTLIIYVSCDSLETSIERVEARMKRRYGDRHGATEEAYRRNYGGGEPYPSAEEVVSALTERHPHVEVRVLDNSQGVSLESFKRQARKLLSSLASSWQEEWPQI